jgi:hypothetical protein
MGCFLVLLIDTTYAVAPEPGRNRPIRLRSGQASAGRKAVCCFDSGSEAARSKATEVSFLAAVGEKARNAAGINADCVNRVIDRTDVVGASAQAALAVLACGSQKVTISFV